MKNKYDRRRRQDDAADDSERHSTSGGDREGGGKEPDTRNATSAGHGNEDETKERQFRKRITILSIVFSGLLLVATSIYTWFAAGQWDVMNDSLKEAKRGSELEYRAYVGVKSVRFIARPNDPATGDIIVTSFNSGRTAGVGTIRGILRVLQESPPEDYPIPAPTTPSSKAVFSPGAEVVINLGAFPTENARPPASSNPPTNEARSQKPTPTPIPTPTPVPTPILEEAPIMIYILGKIEYTDSFRHPRWTKFCFRNIPGTADWKFCPTFNDTDQTYEAKGETANPD